jgi:3-hydroxybutyryl-CoA dehydrogenase
MDMPSGSGITRTAVIGAGLMGHGIAQTFAENGCTVTLCDVDDNFLGRALKKIESNLELYVELGIEDQGFAEGVIKRIRTTTDLTKAAEAAEFVIEATPEDLNLKIDVFNRLDAITGDRAILASNTSTLPITGISRGMAKRDRVVITHWFNPPHLVPVVEVLKGKLTSDETFRMTFQFLKDLGKEPVYVRKEVPGFLVNRIQTAMFREVIALLDDGVATAEDIDKAVQGSFGLRLATMGPLAVADLGGVELWYKGAQSLYPSLDGSTEPRKLWTEMVQGGFFGVKAGKGFFRYEASAIPKIIRNRDRRLLALRKVLYPGTNKGGQ